MKKRIKMSRKEWNKLAKFEQDYISERAHIDGLSFCKEVVRESRKQVPGTVRLFGYGKAEDKNGNLYSYSGSDTKKFKVVLEEPQTAASGVVIGKTDINGREGIEAVLPDGKKLRIGGGEIIMSEKASTDNCEELSRMNVEAGGVAFPCDVQKVANTDRAAGLMPADEYHQEAAGGTRASEIPDRYKDMGFTHVGHMLDSTRPEKKWMVLAKKGDSYKVVHGGQKGMEDFSQHKDEARRRRFWERMGGEESERANDPFSPLYWHKKYGTWETGGMAEVCGCSHDDEAAGGAKAEKFYDVEWHKPGGGIEVVQYEYPEGYGMQYARQKPIAVARWIVGMVAARYQPGEIYAVQQGNKYAKIKLYPKNTAESGAYMEEKKEQTSMGYLVTHGRNKFSVENMVDDKTGHYENVKDFEYDESGEGYDRAERDATEFANQLNKKYNLPILPASSGIKTQPIMKQSALYYLKLKHIMKDPFGNQYIITGYYKDGVMVKEGGFKSTNAPFELPFSELMENLAEGVEFRTAPLGEKIPFENDRDKALLNTEMDFVRETFRTSALEERVAANGARVGKIKQSHSATVEAMRELADGKKSNADAARGKRITGEEIDRVSEETRDAYMRGNYGESAWLVAIRELMVDGYTEEETAWILNSKIARWADDRFGAGDGKKLTGHEVLKYIKEEGKEKVRGWIDEDLYGGKTKPTLSIPNNYKGKKPSEIWDAETMHQRGHFLSDHRLPGDYQSATWKELPEHVQQEFVAHVMMGQYSGGGRAGARTNKYFDISFKQYGDMKTARVYADSEKNAINMLHYSRGIKKDDMVTKDSGTGAGYYNPHVTMLDGASGGKGPDTALMTELSDFITRKPESWADMKPLPVSLNRALREYFQSCPLVHFDKKYKPLKDDLYLMMPQKKADKPFIAQVDNKDYYYCETEGNNYIRYGAKIDFSEPSLMYKASAAGGYKASDLIVKKITKKNGFWQVKMKTPKGAKRIAVPKWATIIAKTIEDGARVTMAETVSGYYADYVFVPAKGVNKKDAKATAQRIAKKLAKTKSLGEANKFTKSASGGYEIKKSYLNGMSVEEAKDHGLMGIENEYLTSEGLIAKMQEWQENEKSVERHVYDTTKKQLEKNGYKMPSNILRSTN